MLTVTDPSMIVADPYIRNHLIEQRRAAGHDRYDEVWEGVYVIMPSPDIEHQGLVGSLTAIGVATVSDPGLGDVYPGINVSDRHEDWEHNYREPDLAIYLKTTRAINCGTHWLGGPDFGIEIRSPDNRTYEKLEFYARVRTSELLIVDRNPWMLELYRLEGERLELAGRCTLSDPAELVSELIPLSFRIVPGQQRPQILVTHAETGQQWHV